MKLINFGLAREIPSSCKLLLQKDGALSYHPEGIFTLVAERRKDQGWPVSRCCRLQPQLCWSAFLKDQPQDADLLRLLAAASARFKPLLHLKELAALPL